MFTTTSLPTSNNSLKKLNPNFVTGFVDAEGCFIIGVSRNSKLSTGYRVKAIFQIHLHIRDRALLEKIQINSFEGVGYIQPDRDTVIYSVSTVTDLEVIINHLDKYPLITEKWSNYQLFKQGLELIKLKEHLTIEGLNKIVGIKAMMNGNGLSEKLKIAFPNVPLVARPKVTNQEIKDPNWLAGFVSGEACFGVYIKKSKNSKMGHSLSLRFSISQHSRDSVLMQSLVKFLGCGQYSEWPDRSVGELRVESIKDINEKIIPFFDKYPLRGVKTLDFSDFKKVVEIANAKGHLTVDGLEQIRQIKEGMNMGRKFSPHPNWKS